MSPLRASVVITTRNRRDELRVALRSAMEQTHPCEVIVIDDASTDGTSDMVRAEFPSARLERSGECRGLIARSAAGYIAGRNYGAELSTTDIIFSIDDDAAFSTPHVVAQTLEDFSDGRIGAVAIPYSDVNKDNVIRQRAPDREHVWVTDRYIGTAHAVRRDVFLQCGGYRECLVHQGEEGDFCLRMLNGGHVVRLGNSDPIHHFESPKRDFRRMDFYGRRNDILFAAFNVPLTSLPLHLAATTLNGLRTAFRVGRFGKMLQGLACGYLDALRLIRERKPVARDAYKLSRFIKARGAVPLDGIRLPHPNS